MPRKELPADVLDFVERMLSGLDHVEAAAAEMRVEIVAFVEGKKADFDDLQRDRWRQWIAERLDAGRSTSAQNATEETRS